MATFIATYEILDSDMVKLYTIYIDTELYDDSKQIWIDVVKIASDKCQAGDTLVNIELIAI